MEYTFSAKMSEDVNACVLGRALELFTFQLFTDESELSLSCFQYFYIEKNTQKKSQYYTFLDQLTWW